MRKHAPNIHKAVLAHRPNRSLKLLNHDRAYSGRQTKHRLHPLQILLGEGRRTPNEVHTVPTSAYARLKHYRRPGPARNKPLHSSLEPFKPTTRPLQKLSPTDPKPRILQLMQILLGSIPPHGTRIVDD